MIRVMIVDDQPTNCQLINQWIKGFATTVQVYDGQKAWQAFIDAHFEKDPFHLIILDIMMPHMNGIDLLRKIRHWERDNLIETEPSKVVFVTALDYQSNALAGFREGCESYLVKPLNKQIFLDTIENLGFDISY